MRFCPFCAQETSDEAGRCVHCGRRIGARTAQNSVVPLPPAAPGLHPTMLGLGPGSSRAQAPEVPVGPTVIGNPAGVLGDFGDPPSGDSPSALDTVVHEPQATKVITAGKLPGQRDSALHPGVPTRADSALDEDTKLPPHAPGMVLPIQPPAHAHKLRPALFDPPTLPGLVNTRRSAPARLGDSLDGLPVPAGVDPGKSRKDADPTPFRRGRASPASGARDSASLGQSGPTVVSSSPSSTFPTGGPVIASQHDEPSDSTSKMSLADLAMSGPSAAVMLAAARGGTAGPKVSQNNIPALPPPPVGPHQGMPMPMPMPSALTGPVSLPPGFVSGADPVTGPSRLPHTGSLVTPVPLSPRPPTLARLPLIPASPSSPGLLDSLIYLIPVAQGVWARRREQARIRGGLFEVQQSLDVVLLGLGRDAYEERLATPQVAEEMDLVRQAEERREQATRHSDRLQKRRSVEEQRLGTLIAEQQQAIHTLSTEADRLEGELRQRARARRTQLGDVSRIDEVLRKLARVAESSDARARAAKEPQAASQARARGDSARGQAEALLPQRETALREIGLLDGPIVQLTQDLGRTRSELGLRKKELLRQQSDKEKLLTGIDADLKLCQAEQEAAEREMQQRMMTIGTVVNLTRPHGTRYVPHYGRVDEIKGRLMEAESLVAQLDTESDLYDEKSVQKGLVILGAGGLCVGLVVALIYIIMALLQHR